jgi:hypothetical protein
MLEYIKYYKAVSGAKFGEHGNGKALTTRKGSRRCGRKRGAGNKSFIKILQTIPRRKKVRTEGLQR